MVASNLITLRFVPEAEPVLVVVLLFSVN